MTVTKYTKPTAGQPVVSVISKGLKTPPVHLKFCNLANPFYYQNSPTTPRYSVTCVLDPVLHADFIKILENIENTEGVPPILKQDYHKDREKDELLTSGNFLIKFQGKKKLGVSFVCDKIPKEPEILKEELLPGSNVVVVFDVIRYIEKNTGKKGVSLQPTLVYCQSAAPQPVPLETTPPVDENVFQEA